MQMRSIQYLLAFAVFCIGTAVYSPVQGQTRSSLVYQGDCDYPNVSDTEQDTEIVSRIAAGRYLTAHYACLFADYQIAAERYTQALAEDPRNSVLMERVMMAYVGLGQTDRAFSVAQELSDQAHTSPVIDIVLIVGALKGGDSEAALEIIERKQTEIFFVDLLTAWTQLQHGRMSEALESFDEVIEQQGLENFGRTHKALAQALVGDYEGAEAILSDLERQGGLNHRGVVALAQILSQLERNSEALDVIERNGGALRDPELAELKASLADGTPVRFNAIRNSTDGAAEVFLFTARLLEGQFPTNQVLRYSRIAEFLNPDDVEATLLSAELLVKLDRFGLATESYNRVPGSHRSFIAAEIGRAEALRASGQTDAAVEVMERLAEMRPEVPEVRVALGDFLRWLERFEAAGDAYDAAVSLYQRSGQDVHWRLYFARGIAREREQRWELAEADFRRALAQEPGAPEVLNYLGYGMVELGINLEEALAMIEEAVAAEPEAYHIIDSLGWAQYRMGQYDQAVVNLERAAALGSVDPIVNDHLGDAYWAVSRRFEAEFQWRRALSFEPEDEVAERIRRKLEIGLDAVLEEEGVPPLGVEGQDD